MACCTNLVYLIDRLGINHQFRTEKTLHFFNADGRHLPIKAWPLPAPLHLSGMLLKWPDLSLADRISIAKTMLSLMRVEDDDPVMDALAVEWLRRRQSERVIDTFWKTILVSALGERIEHVALRPAAKVLLDGFASNRNAYHLLVPQRPLRSLFDEHCQSVFKKNSRIQLHLGCRVDHIDPRNNGERTTVLIRDNLGNDRSYYHVVVCVPWYRIDDVLNIDATDCNSLMSSPITGIHTWWDRSWLKHPHAILVNRKCQWIFGGEAKTVHSNSWYCQIVISGMHDVRWKNRHELEVGLAEDLSAIFPELQRSKLLRYKLVTDPRSVFSVRPESKQYRWACDKYASKNIWLAGDWTDTGWPATMEGAVLSGFSAAKQIAIIYGHNVALPRRELPAGAIIRALRR
jgi:squalene-associated FAD-dependent desaturase